LKQIALLLLATVVATVVSFAQKRTATDNSSLNAGRIVSLKPTLFLATVEAGLPQAILQIKAAGIETVVVPRNYNRKEVVASIRQIARLLHKEPQGEQLVTSLNHDVQITAERLQSLQA
jgi:ABC-type hemin transport system substrate-binding protein